MFNIILNYVCVCVCVCEDVKMYRKLIENSTTFLSLVECPVIVNRGHQVGRYI